MSGVMDAWVVKASEAASRAASRQRMDVHHGELLNCVRAALAAVAPMIAAAERERVAKWHDDQCQEATTRAEAAKAHGETGNVLHHARFAHAHWLSAAAIRALELTP